MCACVGVHEFLSVPWHACEYVTIVDVFHYALEREHVCLKEGTRHMLRD